MSHPKIIDMLNMRAANGLGRKIFDQSEISPVQQSRDHFAPRTVSSPSDHCGDDQAHYRIDPSDADQYADGSGHDGERR